MTRYPLVIKPNKYNGDELEENTDDLDLLQKVIAGLQLEKIEDAKRSDIRFAHYTSADNAIKIINGNSMWMRNAIVMNDPSEMLHGQRCVEFLFEESDAGSKIRSLIDEAHPGLSDDILSAIKNTKQVRHVGTYMISVSAHPTRAEHEGKYGRLSMWREYGGPFNVAIVMNKTAFFSDTNALDSYTIPVLYEDPQSYADKMKSVADNLEAHKYLLSILSRGKVLELFAGIFHLVATSIKHPAYLEEREWRVVHQAKTSYEDSPLKMVVESIRGVPQKIVVLPLENNPEAGLHGLEVPELIDEIIIGPGDFLYAMYEALVQTLHTAEVPNPEAKVFVSGVPLRR